MIAALLGCPACIIDGQYVIRGTVSAPVAGGVLEPLPGAKVVADGGRGGGSKPVYTADDGTYVVTYSFGGVLLPFLAGNSNPDVHIAAPGYQSRTLRLRGDRDEAGVDRHECSECNMGSGTCCGLNAVLSPASRAATLPDPAP